MGRRAKYLTLAARSAAAQQRSLAWGRSSRAREARKASRNTSLNLTLRFKHTSLPPLPPNLIQHAMILLPDEGYSRLFRDALHNPDSIDESPLPQWDHDPPYIYPGPSGSLSERTYTLRLQEVMHGRNLRLQRLHDDEREQFYSGGLKALEGYWDELLEGLTTEIQGWEHLGEYLHNYSAGPREVAMAKHRLQWRARKAYSWYKRLEMMCDQ